MKELELTSNAALTDAVYETALNGSFLEVKLVAGSVGDDEPRGMQPEYIIRKSKFPQNPKRSVRFSGKRTKRSVQKRKARNTQKAETKVL